MSWRIQMTTEPSLPDQAVVRGAEALITRLFGPALKSLGQIFGDWVRLWRYRNLDAIRGRLEAEASKCGEEVTFKALPTVVGLALVEAASRDEDDSLQVLWERLLLNHGGATNDETNLS